ncbi:hypothetical protein AX769_16315 [Frondihabitans sp. PAMC 28766]|uniref:hypothetical protein n=1 Tax=Frondihabitans sp. PAMC 28766 TaxID=1795630 RepID=UPI00078C668D|nr:hypothetical protein [Frondihabitans sp. PAMC 28766]AMM21407.1 hypothetical protein AX769_16315 [Frondihabitans sp. PAMC 28766]
MRRLRQAGAALTVLLIAGAVCSAAPQPRADAVAFRATTANPTSTFAMRTPVAATNPTCANNADGTTVTINWSYTGTTPNDLALPFNGTAYATATGAALSAALSTASLLGLGLPPTRSPCERT